MTRLISSSRYRRATLAAGQTEGAGFSVLPVPAPNWGKMPPCPPQRNHGYLAANRHCDANRRNIFDSRRLMNDSQRRRSRGRSRKTALACWNTNQAQVATVEGYYDDCCAGRCSRPPTRYRRLTDWVFMRFRRHRGGSNRSKRFPATASSQPVPCAGAGCRGYEPAGTARARAHNAGAARQPNSAAALLRPR